ncbi:hypothetical protein THOM_3238 [Trachipleistophora hominis]|uniref:Uncharacterized protein n=1 Tax=Trachipleistophora hominis TaxID=72359 RepID=L7JQW8_TRAHO|nr:hypothetical protein THOM_3238 [Trachipleistophora hominis]
MRMDGKMGGTSMHNLIDAAGDGNGAIVVVREDVEIKRKVKKA